MLQKEFLLAISKADMLDDELKSHIIKELPINIDYIFISSITGEGLMELKDKLWSLLQKS